MKKIIIDTNVLLAKFDVFSELQRVCDFNYEVCVLDKTLLELEKLINTGRFRERQAAKLALKLIDLKKIKIIKTGVGSVDEHLVRLSKNRNVVILTVDKELRKKLHTKHLTVRQSKYLVWC